MLGRWLLVLSTTSRPLQPEHSVAVELAGLDFGLYLLAGLVVDASEVTERVAGKRDRVFENADEEAGERVRSIDRH